MFEVIFDDRARKPWYYRLFSKHEKTTMICSDETGFLDKNGKSLYVKNMKKGDLLQNNLTVLSVNKVYEEIS